MKCVSSFFHWKCQRPLWCNHSSGTKSLSPQCISISLLYKSIVDFLTPGLQGCWTNNYSPTPKNKLNPTQQPPCQFQKMFNDMSFHTYFQMTMVITWFLERMAKQHLYLHFPQQETPSPWEPWRICKKQHASCGAWRGNALTLNTHQELEYASWKGLQNSLVMVQNITNLQGNDVVIHKRKFWEPD